MVRIISGKGLLRVSGHAGAGPVGHDLVCAGASMLIYTLAEQLAALAAEGRVTVRQIRLEPGDAWLEWDQTPETGLVQGCILRGLELLAEEYPEHVRIVRVDHGGQGSGRPTKEEDR